MSYAGCVESESKGAGPKCVQFGVLMRFALWHHYGCVAGGDAMGHRQQTTLVDPLSEIRITDTSAQFSLPDNRLRAHSARNPPNDGHGHEIVAPDGDDASFLGVD